MIELRTLGSVDLRDADGREIRSVLAQPKRLALLAYLAVAAPEGFVRRDTLLALFWPESSDERARGAFRQAVLYLRRSLGEGVLVNRAEDELGIADGTIRCDAADFRAVLKAGDHTAALALYRGDLLDGLFVADAPEFEAWLGLERSAFRAQAASSAWALAEAAVAARDGAAAVEWARRGVELAPLDESGVRRRIALLASTGDRAGAVAAYEAFARRLARELELEPAAETRTLVDEIRQREADVAPSGERAGVGAIPPADLDESPPTPPLVGRGPSDSPPRPSRRQGTPARLAVTGAVAILALTGLAYLALPRGSGPAFEARRVVVIPFENRTGEALMDPVANMAADWIIQGLTGRGALQVVPVTAALASGPHLTGSVEPAGAEPDPRPLARETGAGTAVSGSYYRQGDSLHFQARISDVATARVIAAIGPVSSAVDAPLDGIDEVRERVLAALAPLSDDRDTHIRVARAPPSYEAYHAYVSGFESFVRQDVPGALRHFERASAADPAFMMPAIAAAIMHSNLGNHAAADSIARRVEASRDQLGPMEVATLDMVRGWLRGDDDAAYEASVRQARLAPGSIGEYQVAEQARRLNRPAETVRVLTEMGAERGELRGWIAYWRELTAAHHMLGNHRAELRAARRARALYPANPQVLLHEVVALAALGRIADVDRRIEERLTSASPDWPSAGALMATAAREFRAHGRPDAARALLDRSLEWYRAQSPGGPVGDPGFAIAVMLYEAGRWDEARDAFAALAVEVPNNLTVQGYLGVIAARRGDPAEAERVAAWLRELDRPYLWGRHTLWRARIAAALGQQQQAVDLLRDAFAQGVPYAITHHADIDLQPLLDYPPFRQLMRPKG
jgi:DNA-binding SARP family transcriptional activator/TolB-like protein